MIVADERRGRLAAVLRYEFHGILHFELHLELDGRESMPPSVIRVAAHQVYSDPQVGDRVVVRFLMGLVHGVEREPGFAAAPDAPRPAPRAS